MGKDIAISPYLPLSLGYLFGKPNNEKKPTLLAAVIAEHLGCKRRFAVCRQGSGSRLEVPVMVLLHKTTELYGLSLLSAPWQVSKQNHRPTRPID
jgi:hypothetical protein